LCADGASSINQKGALVFPVFLPCTEELFLAVRLLHREALIADDGQPIVFSQRYLQFPASPHSMLPNVPMLTLACVSTGSAHRLALGSLHRPQHAAAMARGDLSSFLSSLSIFSFHESGLLCSDSLFHLSWQCLRSVSSPPSSSLSSCTPTQTSMMGLSHLIRCMHFARGEVYMLQVC
jgi:hypothetical protein